MIAIKAAPFAVRSVYFRFLSHSDTSGAQSWTSFLEMLIPFLSTAARGCSFAIVSTVPEKPLPPWVTNGMTLLPERSAFSKKE